MTTTGPVAPTPASVAMLWPVPFHIDDTPHGPTSDGFWARRRHINRRHSIPHGLRQLREHGPYDDLRRAAGRRDGTHSGRPYADSDVYKMAEALAWSATPTTALTALREIAVLVTEAQDGDGYLNSWFQCTGTERFSDLHLGHEMYCAGHLIQAAIAEARAGATTDLLGPAIAFADLLVDTFGPGRRTGICGHPQIETALVELYRHTGRQPYLALARRMIDLRGHGHLGPHHRGAAYYCDQTPVRAAGQLDGHCVRAMYLAAGATDVYLETGDTTLLDALSAQWDHTVATKTYLTGGVGCRRKTEAFGAPYELPPDQAFNETCAGVANIMWSWRLLLSTGAGRYADHIERVLYNVLAASVSLTGDRFSYINTLQRHGSAMEHGDKAPYRKSWFGCPCCPTNLMRTVASLGHYLATGDDHGIQIHQYVAGTVWAAGLGLTVRTGYPWSGDIAIEVTATGDDRTDREIRLRVPAWCDRWTVHVNEVPAPVPPPRDGYLSLRRRWRRGDRVSLTLAMPPRFTRPDRRIDAVRGCLAIERGPLVYCVEEVDLPPGVGLDELTFDPAVPLRVTPRPDLLGGVTTIEVGARHHPTARPAWPYRTLAAPDAHGRNDADGHADAAMPLSVTAIPYHAWDNRGLGRMRTWLPVTAAPVPVA